MLSTVAPASVLSSLTFHLTAAMVVEIESTSHQHPTLFIRIGSRFDTDRRIRMFNTCFLRKQRPAIEQSK